MKSKKSKVSRKDKRLAEFIGIILGDGHLHKKENCITITGSSEDFYYYRDHIIPLIKYLFGINPKLKNRNDRNSFYIYFYSKETMNYLTEGMGLVRGNKINAKIPVMIKRNKNLIPDFLRGIFDTDGCLKFSKQNKDKNYYPRIRFGFRKSKFAEEVLELFKNIGFNIGRWEDKRFNGSVCWYVSGKENLERWMKIIDPANLVHKTKYLFWKKNGFCIPRSSLNSRIKALNLNIN